MKKILIIFFLIFAVKLSAQSLWWVDTTSTGIEKKVWLSGIDGLSKDGKLNYSPLPVKGTFTINYSVSTNIKTLVDTSSAGIDSLIFGFTSKHIGINNDESGGVVDSTTLLISKVSTFTPGVTYPLYATESLPLDWAVTKIYFKWSTQATPKANKKSRFIVN